MFNQQIGETIENLIESDEFQSEFEILVTQNIDSDIIIKKLENKFLNNKIGINIKNENIYKITKKQFRIKVIDYYIDYLNNLEKISF